MNRGQLLAVAAISAAVLAYEVLLMRLFSIVSWHHFAYMIISIALLGFGASGTFLTLARTRIAAYFTSAFAVSSGLFAVSSILAFAAAIRLPFNPLEIIWDTQQLVWLGAAYALLVLPFFFGATAIGIAFLWFRQRIGRVYAFDLIGAGLGALGIIGALFVLTPTEALRLVAAIGLISAGVVLIATPGGRKMIVGGAAFVSAIGTVLLPAGLITLTPHMSEYKGLPMALRVPAATVVEERSSPLGLVSVVESPTVPFRYVPGLSLNNRQEPAPQLGIFTDGDAMTPITRFDGDPDSIAYLDFTTAALPYHLLDQPSVLVLGAGGGEQVLLAGYHSASGIDAVELNPNIVDLVAETYDEFAGGLYNRPGVEVHVAEARDFAETTNERYDLVQIPPVASFGAAASGTQSLNESYLFTVEAIEAYLARLRPGGMLAATLWLKLPPRDVPKLLATVVAALDASGVKRPEEQLALIRSWNTATLLVKDGALASAEIETIRDFAANRSFDVAYHPAISPSEVNRYNLLEEPYLYQAALSLIGPERQDFIEAYKFEIEPATDDQPFFFNFFKWESLSELVRLRSQGTAAMLDLGYLILFAVLIQAAVLSVILILLPLLIRRRRFGKGMPKLRVSVYFLALGLGFIFIEIAFIQRFTLFLGHPLYAVAVVLTGFLVFAGTGSALSRRFAKWTSQGHIGPIATAVAGIGVLTVAYLGMLPAMFAIASGWPIAIKVLLSLIILGPLAALMGMPFPLGLSRIANRSEDLIAWAWGINGCASVIAAVLATLLAMHFGFTAVILTAVAFYAVAALASRRGWTAMTDAL